MPYRSGPQAGLVPRISRRPRRSYVLQLFDALVGWLDRPPRPADLPPHLRMDVGLPPDLPTDWHSRFYDPQDSSLPRRRRRRPRR